MDKARTISIQTADVMIKRAGNGHTGELALVPPTDPTRPPITTWKFSPWAATSGYARPVRLRNGEDASVDYPRRIRHEQRKTYLKRPEFVEPRRVRNVETAVD